MRKFVCQEVTVCRLYVNESSESGINKKCQFYMDNKCQNQNLIKCFSKWSGNWKDEEKKTERAFFKTQAWFSTKEDSVQYVLQRYAREKRVEGCSCFSDKWHHIERMEEG